MKGSRLNFCTPVRQALIDKGYSYVKVLSAVNSYLGQLSAIEISEKVGESRVTKTEFKVSQVTTEKFADNRNIVGLFDAWSCAIAKADKVANMETVDLPTVFSSWLQKMKEDKKESEEVPA